MGNRVRFRKNVYLSTRCEGRTSLAVNKKERKLLRVLSSPTMAAKHSQIKHRYGRYPHINDLATIMAEAVHAAQESLIIE